MEDCDCDIFGISYLFQFHTLRTAFNACLLYVPSSRVREVDPSLFARMLHHYECLLNFEISLIHKCTSVGSFIIMRLHAVDKQI